MDGEFIKCCIGGDLVKAQFLYSTQKQKIDIHFCNDISFLQSCTNGHLPIAQWLYSLGGVDLKTNYYVPFRSSCANGHLHVAKWLFDLGIMNMNELKYDALIKACSCENEEKGLLVVQWLYTYSLPGINPLLQYDAFEHACRSNNIKIAQWLYEQGDINIHTISDYLFKLICHDGNYTVALWLYSLGYINIHSDNDNVFIWSCEGGNLDLIQWLYSFGGINIHVLEDSPFRKSCEEGHLAIAQWLYGFGNVDIHAMNENAFVSSVGNGHIDVSKWLYSFGSINIHIDFDKALESCCRGKHDEMITWLLTLDQYPNDIINKYARIYPPDIVGIIYRQGYKATSIKLKKKYSIYIKKQIKYYKFLIRLMGRTVVRYYQTCEKRYQYLGDGYQASHKSFNLLRRI
ncbi:MAG: hypothetical protein Harvfovirus10_30 [Harvfovirus sp.]|uniref:Ankyrin repeat protein n=1 Tax=Harvfovirus sp. TaxID=2487768 RepID=A0A3G5A167_9VIRU|nr:MAG: hypothetical protein Harvfovirus10_30 [Harvfovirus sp.]